MRTTPAWVALLIACGSPAAEAPDAHRRDASGEADAGSDSGLDAGPVELDDAGIDAGFDAARVFDAEARDAYGDADLDASCGAPRCVAESIAMLNLFDTISPALVVEEGTTPGEFLTHVDAQGGGFMPSQSFVYVRFTNAGLLKIDVSDEDAFTSTHWDIAFRRQLVRLNGGVSGPSCVTAATTAPGTTFADVTTVPSGLAYAEESYFDASCELTPDGTGLPGSPATVLSSYWTYPGCVSMTDNVYVIELADGRHVRFQVVSYYTGDNQASCDGPAHTVSTPSGAGNFRVRWGFLD